MKKIFKYFAVPFASGLLFFAVSCGDKNNSKSNEESQSPINNSESLSPTSQESSSDLSPVSSDTSSDVEVKYTVVFDSNGGSDVLSQIINENGKATEPAAPTRDHYTFGGWYLGTQLFDFNTPITSNITLISMWSPEKYQVTFIDSDGELSVNVNYGDKVSLRDASTKTGYTFDGWYDGDKLYDFDQVVTDNLTLEAKYNVNYYTVNWLDEAGNVLETDEVAFGSVPTFDGTLPTKEATERYEFEASGWSPEVVAVEGDTDYIYQFNTKLVVNDVIAPFEISADKVSVFDEFGKVEYSKDYHLEGQLGSLKITRLKEGDVLVSVDEPLIKDVTPYTHIAFSVYNPTDSAVVAGTAWFGDTTINPGEWTEIVLPIAQFGQSGSIYNIPGDRLNADDISGFIVRIMSGLNVGESVYVSSIYGLVDETVEPGTIANFAHLSDVNVFSNGANLSLDTDHKLEGDERSLKVDCNSADVYLTLANPYTKDITDYDYVSFSVYTEATGLQAGTLWCCDTPLNANQWTEVRIPVSKFGASGNVDSVAGTKVLADDITGFALRIMSGAGNTAYVSSVKAVKEAEPVDYHGLISNYTSADNVAPFAGAAELSIDTEHKFQDDEQSLKALIKSDDAYLELKNIFTTDITAYDYVTFSVYVEDAGIKAGTLWCSDTDLVAGQWTEVRIPVAKFGASGNVDSLAGTKVLAENIEGLALRIMSGNGKTVYISEVRAANEPEPVDYHGLISNYTSADNVAPFAGAAELSIDTEHKFQDDEQSLKALIKSDDAYLELKNIFTTDITAYDYVTFSVYVEDAGIKAGTLWCSDTDLVAGQWTEVRIPVAKFGASGNVDSLAGTKVLAENIEGLALRIMSGNGKTVYISEVRAVVDTNTTISNYASLTGFSVFGDNAQISVDDTHKYGEENVSLKVVGNAADIYITLGNPAVLDITQYTKVVFRVYTDEAGIQSGTLWCCDTNLVAGQWTQVEIPVSNFGESGSVYNIPGNRISANNIDGFALRLMGLDAGKIAYISFVELA